MSTCCSTACCRACRQACWFTFTISFCPSTILLHGVGVTTTSSRAWCRCCWRAPTRRSSPASGPSGAWLRAWRNRWSRACRGRLARWRQACGWRNADRKMKAAKLPDWLFDGGGPEKLPERVRAAILRQQERSEILIGWVQFGIVALVLTLYESTRMAEGVVQEEYSLERDVMLVYGAICIVRLVLAHKRLLATWMLYISVIADIFLLMALIYSFHLKYAQTAAFYLKVPTLLYVFVFIALRALRFEARFVVFTGLCAAAGWAYLTWYVASGQGGPPGITHNFVEYMTSNALLVGAEIDKIIAILLTTAVL